MAEFHEIGSSQFHEKATPTGLEKIQVSATEYVTLQAIANLYKEKGGFSKVVIASASPASGTSIKDKFWTLNTTANIQALLERAMAGELVPIALKVNQGLGSNSAKTITGYLTSIVAVSPLFTFRITALAQTTTDSEQALVLSINLSSTSMPVTNNWNAVLYKVPISPSMLLKDYIPFPSWPSSGGFSTLEIKPTDNILGAITKLAYMLGNNHVKLLGSGSLYENTIGIIAKSAGDSWNGIAIDTDGSYMNALWIRYGMSYDYIKDFTDEQIVDEICDNADTTYDLSKLSLDNMAAINFQNIVANTIRWDGGTGVYYTNARLSPVVTLSSIWSNEACTSSLIVNYDVNPSFTKAVSNDVIHLHQSLDEVKPTSGKKVYTCYCQRISGVRHFFINVAPYN